MTIPKMREREEAARLWQAEHDADTALEKAKDGKYDDDNPIHAKYEKLRDELDEKEAAELGITDLRTKQRAAEEATAAFPESIRTVWSDDGVIAPLRCAKSGVIVLNSDEVVHDEGNSDEVYLRAALGLAPRPTEEDEQEEAA